MTDKHAFMDIYRESGEIGEPVEHLAVYPVENSAEAGTALQALDIARQALTLAAAAADAAKYARASRADATWATYQASWRAWTLWCSDNRVRALPAAGGDVALYVAWRARTRAVATIRAELAAIAAAHRDAGEGDPTKDPAVKTVLAGVRRVHGDAPRKKTPLVVEALRTVLEHLDDSPRARRDRLLLLVGWGAALRRSELVALRHEDLVVVPEGLAVTVRRSKTDQTGRGRVIGIPHAKNPRYDAVRAYCAWCEVQGTASGPVFVWVTRHGSVTLRLLGDRTVARVVKRVAARAGLQGDYSGHSLRAGFATSAAAAGASERSIMAQTGHKSLEVARGYIRPASIWLENAAAIAAL